MIDLDYIFTTPEHAHPEYLCDQTDDRKHRYVKESGRDFVEKYLEKFSGRESATDFTSRKKITPPSADAKAAIKEIANALAARLPSVTRRGGDPTYQTAVGSNVDGANNSMNSFMARNVLDELLFMGKVGIYVDKAPRVNPADRKVPYLYVYKKEQIINWSYDAEGTLTNVLLAEHRYTIDEDTGLPNGVEEVTRQLRLWKGRGVEVTITGKKDGPGEPRLMPWTRLPFVILELQESLAKDIADYQIALMNMESSDIAYSLHSNFPFYTEQGAPGVADFMRPAASIMDATDNDATISSEAAAAKTKELRVGNTQGRMYAPEMDRPSFIAPPSDPLKVSMEKEAQIRERIMVQLHLTLTNLRPVRLSSDAKAQEFQGMEAGMFSIGYTLEQAENQIADIWSMYQGSKTVATVRYPTSYSQMSPDQRVEHQRHLRSLYAVTCTCRLPRS
jgi:hypothetical protein